LRYALTVEYDGSAFAGWQRQPDQRTVQRSVESALSRVADHPVLVTSAGRTDAGVHALGQVIHFDSAARRPPHAWINGTNSHLPDDIAVRDARLVDDDFHARFSAVRRSYSYRIVCRTARPALERSRCWWIRQSLDTVAMQEAAGCLIGEHDFTSFRATSCQARQPLRTVYRIDLSADDNRVTVSVEANAFLHHMVRNLVGALIAVGSGRQPSGWMAELLAARDRTVGGVTAPAQGLYFVRVDYPVRYLGTP